MKILITGGAGYIGNTIVDLALAEGHKVKVIDLLWFTKDIPLIHCNKSNYEFTKGDIRNSELIDKILTGVDFIVHTAAVVGEPASNKFPELTRAINYEATINLIEKAKNFAVKGFIFLSTCSNYGVVNGMANENTALKALSLYAKTKVEVEEYLIEKAKTIDWLILRLSTVYGASRRMRFDLTVNDFTLNAYKNKQLNIFLPYSYRPYIHVFDVARTIFALFNNFDKVKRNIFNVGFNGENYQKIQIAGIVKKFIPDTEIKVVKSGVDLRDYQVDFSKLKRFLNLKNKFTVENGVKEILNLLESKKIKNPMEKHYYNTSPDLEVELPCLNEETH